MTVSTNWKGCGVELSADDDDQLVLEVQEHLAEAPSGRPVASREQVLVVIQGRRDDV